MNRRKFFASAIAFIAALFTPKPELDLSRKAFQSGQIGGRGFDFYPSDHGFHVWTAPSSEVPVFPPLQFHRDAFTLSTPPLTADQVDAAFDEVNSMIDRWKTEPLFPKIEHRAYIAS